MIRRIECGLQVGDQPRLFANDNCQDAMIVGLDRPVSNGSLTARSSGVDRSGLAGLERHRAPFEPVAAMFLFDAGPAAVADGL